MPLYTYRAIGDDGKEIQGTVDAPDEDSARRALSEAHIDLQELTEAMRQSPLKKGTPETPKTLFIFEGVDSAGTQRKGSLQAASKRAAFDTLSHTQDLTLTLLREDGKERSGPDPELDRWQHSQVPPALPTNVDQGAGLSVGAFEPEPTPRQSTSSYIKLSSTLSLYASWLLAWYGLFSAVGYYSLFRDVPIDIPGTEGFLFSPLIVSVMLAIFLFLLCHTIVEAIRAGRMVTAIIFFVGTALFFVVRMNIGM